MNLASEDLKSFYQKLNKMKTNHIASELALKVVDHMHSDICDGKLQIPYQEIELPISKKTDRNYNEDNQRKLSEILEKKESMKKQLSIIQEQQELLKTSKVYSSRVMDQQNKYYKSELTTEDIQKLKKLKAEQKKFEKQLEEKTRQYELRMKKIKQEQEHAKQQEKKQKFERKKQQIEKTLELMEKRRTERQYKIQQERKAMKQIANRKKLHEQWHEKWKAVEEQEEKKKQQLKQELRKIRHITHVQIKEHEKKYQQTMKQQKQSRMRNSITMGIDSGHISSYRSVFLEQIKEEEEKQKQLQLLKRRQPIQYLNKIKYYGQKVKVFHKPSLKPKDQQSQAENKQKKLFQTRSLSLFEAHQKGTQYMRTVNSQLAQVIKKRDPNVLPKKEPQNQTKYKNYLKQLKRPDDSAQIFKPASQLHEVRQILKNENLSQQQKLMRAKIMAQKMQNRKVVRTNQGIVDSINAKLQILRQVEI